MAEIAETKVGERLLALVMVKVRQEMREELAGTNEELFEKYESVVPETPLRSLVLLSGGLLQLSHIDLLIAGLNGEWRTARAEARTSLAQVIRLIGKRLGNQGGQRQP